MVARETLSSTTKHSHTVTIGLVMLLASVSTADRHIFPIKLTNLPDCTFPDVISVEIESSPPFPEFLDLHRYDVMNTNAPAFFIKRRKNGAVHLTAITSTKKKTAAYQNREDGAAFIVKCTASGTDIAGTLYVAGRKYKVTPLLAADSPLPARDTDVTPYQFDLVRDASHSDHHVTGHWKREISRNGHLDVGPERQDTSIRKGRTKREIKDYYIDVLAALDFAFFQYWLKHAGGDSVKAVQQAKEYITYIFNGTAEDASWTEGVKVTPDSGVTQVKAETVLQRMEEDFKASYSSLPAHDHLMLFTEYDLYGDDNGNRFNNTAGLAYIGTACFTDGRSISVVEDHGGFQSEGTATHELGHSLGALHDGENNACRSADRYVMAGGAHAESLNTKRNPWMFSLCSVSYFEKHIHSLISKGYEDKCLLTRETPDSVPAVSGLPGQRSGPDEQCRQIYGPQAYLCRGTSFGAAQNICVGMYCRNPALPGSSCTLNTAAAGTCCGNGKWCVDGQCQKSDQAQCYMSATCPFGQREGVVYDNKTCAQLSPGLCYTDNFRLVCCELCDSNRTGIEGCEYGDRLTGCQAEFCGRKLASGQLYDVKCCGTCNYVPPSTLTPLMTSPATTPPPEEPANPVACRDTALVNGTETCGEMVLRQGTAPCCRPELYQNCCATCHAEKSNDSDCPFGDCNSEDCVTLKTSPTACSRSQRDQCCQTCHDLDRRLTKNTATTTITTTRTTNTIAKTPVRRPADKNRIMPGWSTKSGNGCKDVPGVFKCGTAKQRSGHHWVLCLLGAILVWSYTAG